MPKLTDISPSSSICIIGAGAAGLSMAHFLRKKGYKNITVLEKLDRIGGKCYTKKYHGHYYDLGATYVTPEYKLIHKMARETGAKLYSEASPISWERNDKKFAATYKATIRDTNLFDFSVAALRYYFIRQRLKHVLPVAGNYGLAKHPELMVTFADWLKDNQLSVLYNLFCASVSMMGYGYLESIAAPYALRFIGPRTFMTTLLFGLGFPYANLHRFVEGFQGLWLRIAAQVDVKTNVDIIKVKRDDGKVTIDYNMKQVTNGKEQTVSKSGQFDYLVISCPPMLENMVFMDYTGKEKEMFNKQRIRHSNYSVLAVDVNFKEKMKYIPFSIFPVAKTGYPIVFARQYLDSPTFAFYSTLHSSDENKEDEYTASERCMDLIAQIGATATKDNIHDYQSWEYFYSVSLEDFRNGYYDEIEDMQGQNRTFYTGGLMSFEIVEAVAEYSKHLVDEFF